MFGKAQTRDEDGALVRGEGLYAGDLAPEGALHMAIVRSPYAAGRIATLGVEDARAMPGVVLVLTAAEQAAAGLSPFSVRFRPPGAEVAPTPFLPLATEAVHWAGEPVAAVLAESEAQAIAAAEAVLLEVDDAPVVTEAAAAAADEAPPVWADRNGNQIFDHRVGDMAAVEAAIAGAAHVVRQRLQITRVTGLTLEPRTCLAVPQGDRLTLHTGTQATRRVLTELATVLNLPESALRVVARQVGGSFGTRNGAYPEDALALWAARETGRPVRWRATRSEAFLSDTQSRAQDVEATLALGEDGEMLALKVEGVAPVGAQVGPMACHPMVANLPGLAGVYRLPAIAARMRGMHVNTIHMAPYRGAGRPEAIYVIERMVDIAAARLGMDRIALRRRNMIAPDQMPYATPLGFTYDSGDFPRALDVALQAADASGFPARQAEAAARGRLRGLGIACAIEPAGGGPTGAQMPEFAALEAGGEGLQMAIGSGDAGQGHATTFRQIAEHLLGWKGKVEIVTGDTDAVKQGTGTFGSRTMGSAGAAMAESARQILAAALPDAADHLEAAEADIAFEDGAFRIAGTDRAVTLQTLAAATGRSYAAEAWVPTAAGTFPNGAHVAEVEIDPETGALDLIAYTVADDIGTVINPLLAEGQIHGGVAQGLSQAWMERIVYDAETGALLTGSLMDYAVPRADSLGPIAIHHSPTPTNANPLGVKGVGESGTVGGLSAGISAVCDALGIDHIDMPATPARIWAALQAKGGAR